MNIFRQRGTNAIVMRVIPNVIPNFEDLNLPPQLAEVVHLRNGIVLVTGPTGSGKSSTLAAIIDRANSERAIHILSIEDPIEFCHNHKKATIHQRELYSDTPTFALALRAALRQAPKIIFVGEMRDKETIEIALEAAETGHLVLSTLHTIDASKTVERIVGVFPLSDQQTIRNRLARAFRFIISQRLLPRREGKGRVAVLEILKATMRTREYIEKGEGEGKSLVDAMTDGSQEGMQHFDGELERLIRAGLVELETGLSYASNAGNLRLCLVDYIDEQPRRRRRPQPQLQTSRRRRTSRQLPKSSDRAFWRQLHFFGPLVVAQPEKDGLAQFAVGGPFLKSNLRHQFRPQIGDALLPRRVGEGRRGADQRLEFGVERSQGIVGESRSHFSHVAQLAIFIRAQ